MKISGFDFDPTPNFSVSKEVFRAGGVIAGGCIVVSLNGTYHAEDAADYTSTINSINSMMGSCVTCMSYTPEDLPPGCTPFTPNTINNAVGYVNSVSTAPGGSVLDFSYSAEIKFYKNSSKNPLVTSDLPVTPPQGMTITSYNESAGPSTSNALIFTSDVGGNLTKVVGRGQASMSVGFGDNDQCSSAGNATVGAVENFINSRIDALAASIQAPSNCTRITANKKINVGITGGSASKEVYFVTPGAIALVEYSVTESEDPVTGQRSASIRGNITGLEGSHDNALSVYNRFRNHLRQGGAPMPQNASCGPTTYLNLDTCYILQSSRCTEDPANAKVDFEINYQDVEKCVVQGYRVETEYEETYPSQQYVEHNIPGQATLVYFSDTYSAKRAKLTVKSSYYGCDESFQGTISSAVNQVFGEKVSEYGLGSLLKISEARYDGKYSYQRTEEYIECS